MTLHETIDRPVGGIVAPATFHDLMAGIGYLLFQWSLLDRSLDEEIAQLRRAGGDTVGTWSRARTVNERLAEWRALLSRGRRRRPDHHASVESVGARIQDLQRLRNLVATGFVTASTDAAVPTIRCAHPTSRHGASDEMWMDASDIANAIDAMELCRSEMALLRGLGEH